MKNYKTEQAHRIPIKVINLFPKKEKTEHELIAEAFKKLIREVEERIAKGLSSDSDCIIHKIIQGDDKKYEQTRDQTIFIRKLRNSNN